MRLLFIIFNLLWGVQLGHAAVETLEKPQTFFLYVTNNTPYVVHVDKSYYNQTPFKLIATEIQPNSKEVIIGEVKKPPTSLEPVSFYARVGNEQNYWTTPLVRYGLNGEKKDVRLEPHRLFVGDDEFVTEVWAYGSDNRSIILSIDPANENHRGKVVLGS